MFVLTAGKWIHLFVQINLPSNWAFARKPKHCQGHLPLFPASVGLQSRAGVGATESSIVNEGARATPEQDWTGGLGASGVLRDCNDLELLTGCTATSQQLCPSETFPLGIRRK